MSDNPLEPNPGRDARIKEVARELWDADGRPAGREAEYTERADELVRMEMAGRTGQIANPQTEGEAVPGMVVEEASIQDNLGEFPGASSAADQGEKRMTPMDHMPRQDET